MSYTITTPLAYPYITIVTIERADIAKIDFALCNQPTETPDSYYNRQSTKPTFITNGGFFQMSSGDTCMGFRDEGVTKLSASALGAAIFGEKDIVLTDLPHASTCRDFCAAYPVLLNEGVAVPITSGSELDYNARRTAIGWNDKQLYIMTVDAPGARYSVMQNLFKSVGAKYAMNLDGGGSTRLLVNGQVRTSQSWARAVDSVFAVYLNSDSSAAATTQTNVPTTGNFYRVQVGAFTSKTNAERMLAQLNEKGFEGYVRKVGLFYKVQLGAFSVRLNAERLVDRLQAAGFSAFITK